MKEERYTVAWPNGIHLRRAAELVLAAKPFAARVTLHANGKTAEVRSPLGIMVLGAVRGTELRITADGSDEEAALAAVIQALSQEKQ